MKMGEVGLSSLGVGVVVAVATTLILVCLIVGISEMFTTYPSEDNSE